MEKAIALALNQFVVIPPSLREAPPANSARAELLVPLASLYHHYYLDSHGKVPPNPDPAQFEHLQFLLPSKDFRIQGEVSEFPSASGVTVPMNWAMHSADGFCTII